MTTLKINGKTHTVDAPPDMPLLWVLRDRLGMTGTKFGCGAALCGACTVHLDGVPRRSCVMPVSAAVGHSITTIEAIGNTAAGKRIQQAWLDREVVQCGYCQSGQIMAAAALLAKVPAPTDADITRPCRGASAVAAPIRASGRPLSRRRGNRRHEDGRLSMDHPTRRQLLVAGGPPAVASSSDGIATRGR